MFRFVLSLVVALALAAQSYAGRCGVSSSSETTSSTSSVSVAQQVQQAQLAALLNRLTVAPRPTASAVATAGSVAPQTSALAAQAAQAQAQADQLAALLAAQQQAAAASTTASALINPALLSVEPVCTDCQSRVRAAARTVTKPVRAVPKFVPRPARSRSFSKSVSISRT